MVYLEVFRAAHFADVSLCEWLTRTPRAMVAQTLNLDNEVIERFPDGKPVILPV
jgi:oxalate decarboxylase